MPNSLCSASALVDVIVLNGGSSSGKSSLGRAAQALLPEPWLLVGCDDLVEAMPPAMEGNEAGLVISPDGAVRVGPGFLALEGAWRRGVAAMAAAGAPVILDEVFLGGAQVQAAWRAALAGLRVLWVGVRCDAAQAAAREARRGDRVGGMAALQALAVHEGVAYDLEIDTTDRSPQACAEILLRHLASAAHPAALPDA